MIFGRWIRVIHHFFGHLKWKLFICFLLISIIPSAITGIVLYSNSYKAIEEKIGVYSHQIMLQSAGRLDALLTGIEDISLQIVSSREIQDLIDEIATANDGEAEKSGIRVLNQKLLQIMSSKREIVGAQILLIDRDLAITSGQTMLQVDYKSSDEYIQAMARPGAIYWRGTVKNQSPSMLYEYISTLSRTIYDTGTGKVLGALVLGTKEFAMADTFSYIDLGPNGFVFIMDEDGKVVSHLSKSKLTLTADYSFVPKIIYANEGDTRVFSTHMDDQKFMVSYSQSNANGWYVVSAIPYSYLMERITDVGRYSFQWVIVLLIIALIISLVISISISRPVQQLVTAMKRVEEGDLKVKVKLRSSNEISILGNSFNRMILRINFLIDRVYEVEILQKEAEIKALQSQINPHFLYNTLSVIDSIATLKQEKEISTITQMLADIFRYSTSGNEWATIEEEINQIQRYLNIQQFRYGEALRWQFIIDPSIKECKIIKLLLQPIVENAVQHGIQKGGTVKVIVLPRGTSLSIVIEDNGRGMSDSEQQQLMQRLELSYQTRGKNENGTHIGLANVNSRIKSVYGEQYGLSMISSTGLGTKVTLTIPIVEDQSGQHIIA